MAESVAAGSKWIPFYRRRWFVIVCLLTISPIAWLPLFTGKIYRKASGEGSWVPVKTSSRVIYILLSFWLLAAAIFSAANQNNSQPGNQTQSSSQTPATANNSTPSSNGPAMPADEAAFVSAVTSGQSAYDAAANDMAKGGTRADRKNAICKALQNGAGVTGWVGTIKTLSSNSDGKGVLEISVAPNVVIGTWNNAVSDIQDNTLLDQKSTVFRTVSNMKEGDTVFFSGNFISSETDCVEERSITLGGAMQEPEFVFQFSSTGDSSPAAAPAPQAAAAPAPQAAADAATAPQSDMAATKTLPDCSDTSLSSEAVQAVSDAFDKAALPRTADDTKMLEALVEGDDPTSEQMRRSIVATFNHEIPIENVRICVVADVNLRPAFTVVVVKKGDNVGGLVMNFGIPGATANFGDDVQ
jgi:hypothetical protein